MQHAPATSVASPPLPLLRGCRSTSQTPLGSAQRAAPEEALGDALV